MGEDRKWLACSARGGEEGRQDLVDRQSVGSVHDFIQRAKTRQYFFRVQDKHRCGVPGESVPLSAGHMEGIDSAGGIEHSGTSHSFLSAESIEFFIRGHYVYSGKRMAEAY